MKDDLFRVRVVVAAHAVAHHDIATCPDREGIDIRTGQNMDFHARTCFR